MLLLILLAVERVLKATTPSLSDAVVFIHEGEDRLERRQGSIGKDVATTLIRDVASSMRGVPPHSSVTDWTDAPTVEIVVRDSTEWRIADVYGLTRGKETSGPAGFAAAYRELLAARPSTGNPFSPTEIQILVWGFEHARGDPLPWPSDLPAPPADIIPKDDGPGDPHSFSFTLDTKYAEGLRRLLQTAHAANPPRAIGFNGHKWTVNPVARFRGQAVVESALRCARVAN